ncbi:MAG: rhamnulokinase [Alphaproteobacteria bacterium]
MPSSAHLAFDLGAGSGRVLLGLLQDDRLTVRELYRFPNEMLPIREHLHWDLFGLFKQIKEGLRLCAHEIDISPTSVGVDTWGVDFGLLARDGSVLGLPHTYRDPRTEGAMDSFFQRVPRERVYELTGIQFLPFNTLFQLEAMVRDNSPLLAVATDLLFMPDLFHYLLSGEKVTEFTFATTSQLYNSKKGDWDEQLLHALYLPQYLFQDIVAPGSVIGTISDEIARETGFAAAPLVAVATHDTGSAVAAVPAEGDDWAYISSGTWSLMGVEMPQPIINEEARTMNFTNEGGVGGAYRVLKNITGLWLLQECRRVWSHEREVDYDELTERAAEAAPFVSLIDVDDPAFLNPPDMPAAIAEYCRRTNQPAPESVGATVRCILESLALKYRWVLEQLWALRPQRINRLHVIGGGAQNELLCQFTAEAAGLPVLAGPVEATAIGNLLVQAMALEEVTSPAHLREVVRNSFEVTRYEPRQHLLWQDVWERYQDLKPK